MNVPSFLLRVVRRDRFLKKKCGNETVGASGLANGGRGAVGRQVRAL